jgi:hypothetical protein
MKLLIIDGVAGGASAGPGLSIVRGCRIVVFERDRMYRSPTATFPTTSVERSRMGETANDDALLRTRVRLDVRTRSRADAIDRAPEKTLGRDLGSATPTRTPTPASGLRNRAAFVGPSCSAYPTSSAERDRERDLPVR